MNGSHYTIQALIIGPEPMAPIALDYFFLDLFAVKPQGLKQRPIAHRKEHRIFAPDVFMAVPAPGGNDKKVARAPVEICFSRPRDSRALNHMIVADRGAPVRATRDAMRPPSSPR